MAFDISLGEASHEAGPSEKTFDEFYARHGATIGKALALACGDDALTNKAFTASLIRSSQRWKYLVGHVNPEGWALQAGLVEANKALRDEPPTAVNEATGGYTRGLGLVDALAALPLNQRAALVVAYFLGWTDQHISAGFETSIDTITTRRTRALSFLGHHLRTTTDEVEKILISHLADQAANEQPVAPEAPDIRRRGRRRTIRNRIVAGFLVISVIATGGALFRVGGSEDIISGPEPVAGPNTSPDWFDPVSDGQGGFIALNTQGASRFVRSVDGAEWFEAATWNSRAVDLRTEVTAFVRTGDQYVAVIEAPPSIDGFVAPHIATSTNLVDWSVRQIDLVIPEDVEGLRTRYEVIGVAAAGDQVLLAVEETESIDYRFFGVTPNEACVESSDSEQRTAFLCDGQVITVDRLVDDESQRARFFIADSGGEFVETRLPFPADPRSLVGFSEGFAAVEWPTGNVWTSADGELWGRAFAPESENRFVFIEGTHRGATLVIDPGTSGWTSSTVDLDAVIAEGTLPIAVDPAAVWNAPEMAVGPAGWALFVTTSRAWERTDVTPGWAVDTGAWIVSRLPGSVVIVAQSADGDLSYRYRQDSDAVRPGDGDSLTLFDPETDRLLIEVTQEQIDRSRQASMADSDIKAEVFFSTNGQSWESIWQTSNDTWFGSVAVGDGHVLLSDTRLTGGPIVIPLSD